MYVPSFIDIDRVVFELFWGRNILYFDEYLINYLTDFNEIFRKLFFHHFAHIFQVWWQYLERESR